MKLSNDGVEIWNSSIVGKYLQLMFFPGLFGFYRLSVNLFLVIYYGLI